MTANDTGAKPATAARIYDFQLGGTHNYPADRAAAAAINQLYPQAQPATRANRKWLGRAVRYIASEGMRQFLDIGSGIPTEGNVHEIAQSIVPDAHVVYVDADPVAVSEAMEILEGSQTAAAMWGDLSHADQIVANPQVRELIDFSQPIALILANVLHFLPDEVAYDAVATLIGALPDGSRLVINHGNIEKIEQEMGASGVESGHNVYRQRTATPIHMRTRAQIERFFGGLPLIEPGLVYVPEWRPDPAYPSEFEDNPSASGGLGAVARIG
jgi:hypothetical protein